MTRTAPQRSQSPLFCTALAFPHAEAGLACPSDEYERGNRTPETARNLSKLHGKELRPGLALSPSASRCSTGAPSHGHTGAVLWVHVHSDQSPAGRTYAEGRPAQARTLQLPGNETLREGCSR